MHLQFLRKFFSPLLPREAPSGSTVPGDIGTAGRPKGDPRGLFSGRRPAMLKVQGGSLRRSSVPDTLPSPLLVMEGGRSAEDIDSRVGWIDPHLILEDRSSPDRPRWRTPPPVEMRSFGLNFVPEYSDLEREATQAATRASALLAASMAEWLDNAGSPLPRDAYEEPLAAFFNKHLIDRLSVFLAAGQLASYRPDVPLVIGWTDGRVALPLIDRQVETAQQRPVYLLDCRPRAQALVPFPKAVAAQMARPGNRGPRPDGSAVPPIAADFADFFATGSGIDLGIALGGKHLLVVSGPDPSGNLLFTGRELLPSLAAKGPVAVLSIDRREKAFDDLATAVKAAAEAPGTQAIELLDVNSVLGSEPKMRRTAVAWRRAAVTHALRRAASIQIEGMGLSLGDLAADLVARLADKTLPRLLEFGFRLVGSMQNGCPVSLSMLRSRPPLVRTVAWTAHRFGVRTVDINPTSLSPWVGHRKPLGDFIAIPDRRGVALLNEQFGLDKKRIVPVGSARLAATIASLRDYNKASLRQELALPPAPTPVVLFCSSYGHPTLYRELLGVLAKVLQRRPEAVLLVKPHPKESAEDAIGYDDVLTEAKLKSSSVLSGAASPYQAVAAADVVVTAFSTIGFEASVLGTPVIAFTGAFDSSTPTEHVMSSIPETLRSLDSVGTTLEDFLDQGPIFSGWQARRNAYLSENPEMSDTRLAERLATLIVGSDVGEPMSQ